MGAISGHEVRRRGDAVGHQNDPPVDQQRSVLALLGGWPLHLNQPHRLAGCGNFSGLKRAVPTQAVWCKTEGHFNALPLFQLDRSPDAAIALDDACATCVPKLMKGDRLIGWNRHPILLGYGCDLGAVGIFKKVDRRLATTCDAVSHIVDKANIRGRPTGITFVWKSAASYNGAGEEGVNEAIGHCDALIEKPTNQLTCAHRGWRSTFAC